MPAPSPEKLWERAGLWAPYMDYDPDLLPPHVRKVVDAYCAEDLGHWGKGLWISGPPGTGKTALAHYVAKQALEQKVTTRMVTPAGYVDLFLQRMDVLQLSRDTKDPAAAELYWQISDTIKSLRTKTKLVIIDDFGREHRTPSKHAVDELRRLVRARGHRGLRTIYTTNLEEKECAESYGPETWSFLHQSCVGIALAGADKRTPK